MDCLIYTHGDRRPGVSEGSPRGLGVHCLLDREVQFWNAEANRGPQLYLHDTGREFRSLPPPNFYGASVRSGTMNTTGDTGKSKRGGPGRAGGRDGGAYHGA